MKKIEKGTCGYIAAQRKREIAKTVILFALAAAVYIAGYVTTHTNKNLLTIAAVLGCLPACNRAVHMILFLRAKGCSASAMERIAKAGITLSQRFDLYMTSYSNNFQISHMVMRDKNLIAYTESPKFAETAFYDHLRDMLMKNGWKEITVKVYSDLDKYLARALQLQDSEMENKPELQEKVLHLMENLSL